jgi:phosphohistidine phosphatase
MNIYILRHGLAEEPGSADYPDDADRPLTSDGARKLWKIADGMKALGLKFNLILSSPFARARQTAEIVAQAFNVREKLEFSDTLKPDGDQSALIEVLSHRNQVDNALLVGHEPYLSSLISMLISGDGRASVVMKKAGLCKISADSLKSGRCASLRWLLTPKQMTLLAP